MSSGAPRERRINCAGVLAIVAVFIVYGSLFPFQYYERHYPGGALSYLLSTWRNWDRGPDLLSNVLLYGPFGFMAMCTLPPRLAAWQRAVLAVVAGAALSASMELSQFHDRGRVTDMGDVYANAIGAAVGAVAGAAFGAGQRWRLIRDLSRHPRAALLLTMWGAYRLYPFVPTEDVHHYWRELRQLMTAPEMPRADFAQFALIWLLVSALVESVYGFRLWLLLFPALVGAELLSQTAIIGRQLRMADIAGAGVAFALRLVVLRPVPRHFTVLAVAFAAMVVLLRLAPFRLGGVMQPFHWMPFTSLVEGSIGVAMQAFCEKLYLYGGLIWLLNRAGMRLEFATVATALMLLATSVAEMFQPGRSAETGDAMLALAVGAAFRFLPDARAQA